MVSSMNASISFSFKVISSISFILASDNLTVSGCGSCYGREGSVLSICYRAVSLSFNFVLSGALGTLKILVDQKFIIRFQAINKIK